MKIFTKLLDPVDSLPRWYWRFADGVRREKTWHGPFSSESAAKADADQYDR